MLIIWTSILYYSVVPMAHLLWTYVTNSNLQTIPVK